MTMTSSSLRGYGRPVAEGAARQARQAAVRKVGRVRFGKHFLRPVAPGTVVIVLVGEAATKDATSSTAVVVQTRGGASWGERAGGATAAAPVLWADEGEVAAGPVKKLGRRRDGLESEGRGVGLGQIVRTQGFDKK